MLRLADRVERLWERLPADADAALITSDYNRQYLSGFVSSDGLVMLVRGQSYLLVDSRYSEAASRSVRHMACREYSNVGEMVRALAELHGVKTLLVEEEGLSLAQYRRIQGWLAGMTVRGALDRPLSALRQVKTPDELACIRTAQQITDDGFAYILPRITPGRTEREVALDLEMAMRRQGADGVAFDFIVVAGENSSLPHGVPGDRVLRRGDVVTMDFGARWGGYCSDMTRTVVLGEASEEQRLVYDTVLRAQQAALSCLRSGITGRQGDAAARDVIEQAGYGNRFGHGTGHGVGVQIHEQPRLSPRFDEPLQVGEVVTVEPGIYLPGRFGVRIEDMVCITANGCDNLTASPKDLLVL